MSSLKWSDQSLTACSVAIVSEATLIKAVLDASFVPHFADLRHAEFWFSTKVKLSVFDGKIVFLPVPQVLELLVFNG